MRPALTRLSGKIALGLDELFGPRYVNFRLIDPGNIGDMTCSPVDYFESLQKFRQLSIADCRTPQVCRNKTIILGGGGLLRNDWFDPMVRNMVEAKNARLICWGAGLNSYRQTSSELPDYLDEFDLIGIRDYGLPYEWVPCASCLSPLFDREYEIEHEVVIYDHPRLGKIGRMGSTPFLDNGQTDLETVIAFLGSAATVVTSSYHGAYWATLLNRRVIICNPFSSKFYYMKHQHPIVAADEWQAALPRGRQHPEALTECREANLRFHEWVMDYLDGDARRH